MLWIAVAVSGTSIAVSLRYGKLNCPFIQGFPTLAVSPPPEKIRENQVVAERAGRAQPPPGSLGGEGGNLYVHKLKRTCMTGALWLFLFIFLYRWAGNLLERRQAKKAAGKRAVVTGIK